MLDVRGAIFDLDGTLLDSMGVWEEIDIAFLAKRSIAVPQDYVEKVTPMGFLQAAEYTIERLHLSECAQDIIAEWGRMSIDAYSHRIALKPYAKEYLKQLKAKGIRLAVATALTPDLYGPALRNNGILEYFDAFASLSEVSRGKGSPDIYLLAASRLGLRPEKCVVFEDILEGIKGAKAGGFLTCGVYDRYSAHEKDKILASADRYIISFKELLESI